MDLKHILMLCLFIEFLILQLMLLTRDDVVVAATALGFYGLTFIALEIFTILYLKKYGRMKQYVNDYLVANTNVGMETAMPGFNKKHIKDITMADMASLAHRLPQVKRQ